MALITVAKGPEGGDNPPNPLSDLRSQPPTAATYREAVDEPVFEYLVDPPYKSYYKEPAPEAKRGRHYYNMKLEDFDDYKTLGEPVKLHGPAPYMPHLCGCNRYYVCRGMCVCSMSCKGKPLYAWAKAHPVEFAEKQKEMRRWRMLAETWWKQQMEMDEKWDAISWSVRMRFYALQDDESAIGCASCERDGRDYCRCECDGCGSKWCHGCRDDDDDGYNYY